jgi:small subunit ribosomal protein S8
MSITDPISDVVTRIRNGIRVHRDTVAINGSRLNKAVVDVLKREGYLDEVREVLDRRGHASIQVALKYDRDGEPVISRIGRVSKPGRRVYRGVKEIPRVLNGIGIAVVSTSKGVLSDREARAAGVGGEILCEVW